MIQRREMLIRTAASSLCAMSCTKLIAQEQPRNPLIVFAKHVQSLPAEELGRRLKRVGANGIEATLRNGGQIEPGNLSQELTGLVETLAKQDQRIWIAASDITTLTRWPKSM